MRARIVPAVLLLLLTVLQWQLWTGRGSMRDVSEMRERLIRQKDANSKATVINDRLISEVRDLQEGMEMVEERARLELGMVKPNEVFVQISR